MSIVKPASSLVSIRSANFGVIFSSPKLVEQGVDDGTKMLESDLERFDEAETKRFYKMYTFPKGRSSCRGSKEAEKQLAFGKTSGSRIMRAWSKISQIDSSALRFEAPKDPDQVYRQDFYEFIAKWR